MTVVDSLPERPEALDLVGNPRMSVLALLEQSKLLLAEVQRIDEVVEWKARAGALEEYTRQRDLGRESELAAAEIVRRCERRIGQLIREGQQRGEIRATGDNCRTDLVADDYQVPPGPAEVARVAHRSNLRDAYAMSDGVSDEEFDQAVTEAKDEQNLSRANVVRKVKQIKGEPAPAKPQERSEWQRGTRRIDSNRIVAETAMALEGLASATGMADVGAVDRETVTEWADSLTQSLKTLNRFVKELTRG